MFTGHINCFNTTFCSFSFPFLVYQRRLRLMCMLSLVSSKPKQASATPGRILQTIITSSLTYIPSHPCECTSSRMSTLERSEPQSLSFFADSDCPTDRASRDTRGGGGPKRWWPPDTARPTEAGGRTPAQYPPPLPRRHRRRRCSRRRRRRRQWRADDAAGTLPRHTHADRKCQVSRRVTGDW